MTNKLAIIIPAYKIAYLDDCLESIAQQSSKEFKLYIGNDYSPDDIDSIVDKYRDRIDLEYKIFDNNLGSSSLVKHWERCINMMGDEEWIWLFSDDDMMEENAVECFYNQKRSFNNVYRFNFNIMNYDNQILSEVVYSDSETSDSFLENRLQYKYNNVITNYIFSKESYLKARGFVDFPLAWGSDDASIIQFAEMGEIILIHGSRISWRHSGKNITTVFDLNTTRKKIEARIKFVEWLFNEKKYLLKNITDHKKKIAKWIYHGIQSDTNNASYWLKFNICYKVLPYLGYRIYEQIYMDAKDNFKRKIKKLISN